MVTTSLFFVVRTSVSVAGGDEAAAAYKFKEMPIAMPPGYESQPKKTIREVNPAYEKIRAWISSRASLSAVARSRSSLRHPVRMVSTVLPDIPAIPFCWEP